MGEDFGEGDGEEAAGEEEDAGEGDADDLGLGERVGFSAGVGEAFWRGLTGPVGLSGGGGFALGVGEGEGEGAAAATNAAPKQTSSAKMNGRDLMAAAARPP